MSNAMDEIIVRFGPKKVTAEMRVQIELAKKQLKNLETMGEMAKLDVFKQRKKELQKIIAKDVKNQELPLSDFLKLDSACLPKKEQQIQKLLAFLYRKNAENPAIYKNFPKREKPLVIDCTTISFEGTGGIYNNIENIIFVCHKQYGEAELLDTLAHELKHAEQWFDMTDKGYNAYQQHQIHFLKEAQAKACGNWVKRLFLREEKTEQKEKSAENSLLMAVFGSQDKVDDFVYGTMASEDMPRHLVSFLNKEYYYQQYKDEYDKNMPILYQDKGLTSIPSVFGLEKQEEVKILKLLNQRISKKARTPDNLILQAIHNDDAKTVARLLPMKDKNGNYLVSESGIIDLMIYKCYKNLDFYLAVQQSGRLKKEDYTDLLGSVFHFAKDELYNAKELKERKKVFACLVSEKDKKGGFIVSQTEINECIDYAEMMEEKESAEIVKYAKVYMAKNRPVACLKVREDYTR